MTSDETSATLAGLIEAVDVLARAERGVRRAMEGKRKSVWRRWLAGDDSAALTAVLDGIQLGRRRLERSLAKHGLNPILAVDHPFDAETMEVIEAVTAPIFRREPSSRKSELAISEMAAWSASLR